MLPPPPAQDGGGRLVAFPGIGFPPRVARAPPLATARLGGRSAARSARRALCARHSLPGPTSSFRRTSGLPWQAGTAGRLVADPRPPRFWHTAPAPGDSSAVERALSVAVVSAVATQTSAASATMPLEIGQLRADKMPREITPIETSGRQRASSKVMPTFGVKAFESRCFIAIAFPQVWCRGMRLSKSNPTNGFGNSRSDLVAGAQLPY